MKAEDEKWSGKKQPDWNHRIPQRNQWKWDEGGAKNKKYWAPENNQTSRPLLPLCWED